MSLTFSFPFVGTPAFFTGTNTSGLVPDIFPVAINGRPYMIDQASNQFVRGYEPRVRDSVDQSTAPGEAAINPGGLWRRGEVSWHYGAGQKYADTAEAQDYRFFRSKGVNPWTKGQLSLLNAVKSTASLSTSATNLPMVEVNGYVYVGDGQTLKYTQNPFASSPTWTSVTSGAPAATINDITTDGKQIYVSYANEGILMSSIGGASVADHYATSGGTFNYTRLGFAKGFVLGFHNDTSTSHVHAVPYAVSTGHGTAVATIRDPGFTCVGFAGGQTHIYVAGRSNDSGLVYKLGIKTDGTIDVAVVALELPTGEYPTAIYGYLGAIILGTNKGVRYCSADATGNLIAGALIPTSGDVKDFTAEDRFVWFTWSNYETNTGGLGRLDLSVFIAPNTPAFASDLMYETTASVTVNSVVTASGKRVFAVSGVGVIVEDADNLVTSGTITSGIYRWGIPDRKFVAFVDTRAHPLVGTIKSELALDEGEWLDLGTWDENGDTENSFAGDDDRAIEAKFRFTLARATATTGPEMTRWTARAYAAPFRSEVFQVPVLLHERVRARDKDHFFDPDYELAQLQDLIRNPRIVTLQIGKETVSVITEDIQWIPRDGRDRKWLWDGTAIVTMRSVQD